MVIIDAGDTVLNTMNNLVGQAVECTQRYHNGYEMWKVILPGGRPAYWAKANMKVIKSSRIVAPMNNAKPIMHGPRKR